MKSFGCALRGIIAAARQERHMRIHLCFAFYVVLAGLVTGIGAQEWSVLLLCIALVISLELVNTALERLCDRVTGERDELIRQAKDCAAGAVLIAAVIAAIVGAAVFLTGGRPQAALNFAESNRFAAGAIVLTLPAWIYYIFKRRSPK